MHVPETGDEVLAVGVDDFSGFEIGFRGGDDAGDAVVVDDHGGVGLGLAGKGVDDGGVRDDQGLCVGGEREDSEGKKEVMKESHRMIVNAALGVGRIEVARGCRNKVRTLLSISSLAMAPATVRASKVEGSFLERNRHRVRSDDATSA